MSLEERLRERIRRDGPISFYEWMKAALYDEQEGYYCRADATPQGRAGDYRTAPETSPLFAATFAAYFAKLFARLQSKEFTIVEVGPGGGEFAFGALQTLKLETPELFAATTYILDESSETARQRAESRLFPFSEKVSFRRLFDLDRVNAGIVFSNELIDAFPVDRVVMRDGELRQLFVGLDRDQFVWIEGNMRDSVAEYCHTAGLFEMREGQTAEINLDAEAFIASAAKILRTGYVITVDYGAERRGLLSDDRAYGTLRAFQSHQFADNVLARPGLQDLTTTIDWTQVIEAGERAGLRSILFERLDRFLIAEGILERIEHTVRRLDAVESARMTTAARELILPNAMASSFQVLVQEKAIGV